MALAITAEHESLADVVRSFAVRNNLLEEARAALDAVGRPSPLLWDQLAEVGWLGLHVPSELGGSGFGMLELAIVAEQLGYFVSPGTFLPTVVAADTLARHPDQKPIRHMAALLDGRVSAGLGLSGSLTFDRKLQGDAGPVLGGRWASFVLVRVGSDVIALDVAHDGVTVEPLSGLDPSLGLARVICQAVDIDADNCLPGAADVVLGTFRTVAAAEAAGGAQACLDMATEYAKVRQQFGRTIGSFQAIKHHLSNMLVGLELGRAAAWDAARCQDGDQKRFASSAAASVGMSVYQENAQKNIQIHGGIGYTWEHNAHLYLRRAAALRVITETAGNPNDDIYELSEKNVGRIYAVDLPPEADRYRVEARELVARYHETAEANRRSLLVESGYLVPHWPRPFGRGAGPVEQLVIEQELASIDVPNLRVGGWVLLTLTQTATEEQIERWILPSLRGELVWCQLFSEPDAGSDAAAIQTRARRVKGGWQVTGQKAWTSAAQNCNRGLATVRTDPDAPKHKGITAVAVDLTASGVEVRPLRDMTGESRFNEVFFDEVFVPDSDVVGEVNGGWSVARATLGNERVTLGSGSRIGVSAAELPALATRSHAAGEDARRSIARLLAEEHAMRVINLRQVARAVSGALPGSEGNVTKLLSAEHMQRVSELALTLMGLDSVTGDHEDLPYQYLFDRCLSIAGGTSEITRNVIAERILGLPRDPLIR